MCVWGGGACVRVCVIFLTEKTSLSAKIDIIFHVVSKMNNILICASWELEQIMCLQYQA